MVADEGPSEERVHGDMIEVLCQEITARVVKGDLGDVASDALKDAIGGYTRAPAPHVSPTEMS